MGQLEDPELAEGSNPMYLTLMQFGGFFSSGPPTEFYQNILIFAVYIQSVGTGAVCGVLIKRRFIAGLRHSFVMMVIAYSVIMILGI